MTIIIRKKEPKPFVMPDHIPPLLQSLLKSTTEHFIEIFNKQPLACTFLVMCSIAYLNQKQLLKLMPQTITSDDAPNDQNMDMLSLPIVQIEPSQNQIHLNAHNQQTFFETLNAYHYFNFSSSLSTCMNRLRYYNNQASSFIGYVNSHINDFIEKTKQSTLAFCIPWVDVIASTETIPMTFNQTLLKYINVVINPYLEYNLLGFNHNVLNVYNDDQFFNKFNTLLSMLMFHKDTVIPYQTKLDIAKAIQADQFSSNAMKWHWLHLQNLILEMKRILVDDSEINIYRLFHLSSRWLETLYLENANTPSSFKYHDARNMAGIFRSLIESTNVYITEETPHIKESEFADTSNGLLLTIGITDLLSSLIIHDHQSLNLEVFLKRTSDDVNISMKLIEAYVENHDQTINHLIYKIAYYLLVYSIIVTCISICLLSTTVNPMVSITIVSCLAAIPVLTALYTLLAPNPLSKKQLGNSEKALIKSARERHISEYERDYELDSLLNHIGSTIIFYENLINKILYGLIFSTLLACVVAFPIIFFSIHVLPLLIGFMIATIVGIGLIQFLQNIPKFEKQSEIKLVHNDVDEIVEKQPLNEIEPLSLEHTSNTLKVSCILFLITFLNSEKPLQNWLFKNSWSRFIISQILPMHPLVGNALIESLPLWDELDKGVATKETHKKLRLIAEKASSQLPRDSLFNKSIANIFDHIIELHSLERPPANFTDFSRTLFRLTLPYSLRIIAGTDQIQSNVESCLTLCYPEVDKTSIHLFAKDIQAFLVAPSNDQIEWFHELAQGILKFDEKIKLSGPNGEKYNYRRQWHEKIVFSAKCLLGQETTSSTVRNDPILNIIQGFLEITQDALYQKRQLTKIENQVRDFLIRYSIMIEDIKYTEDTQYEFVAHYRYCWKHIPKVYFPSIIVVSIMLLSMTPLGIALPIVISLLIGGLFLIPWLTNNSDKITGANELAFDNLKEVANEADKDIKADAFLSPLLSENFKSVSDIFATARNSLRQLTTITIIIGIIILGIIAFSMTHIGPLMIAAMGAAILTAIIFNVLFEKYYSVPQFKNYQYHSPGIASSKFTSQFFPKIDPIKSYKQPIRQTIVDDNLTELSAN